MIAATWNLPPLVVDISVVSPTQRYRSWPRCHSTRCGGKYRPGRRGRRAAVSACSPDSPPPRSRSRVMHSVYLLMELSSRLLTAWSKTTVIALLTFSAQSLSLHRHMSSRSSPT